jgi:hypothetical protein
VIEKRKTRELELPASKRSRSKSKSPPSVTGTGGDQLEVPQEAEQEIPRRSKDQVPLKDVFDCLIGVVCYLDSLERVREVCT